jgi:ATP-dependent RNA helicase DeaD
MGREGVAFTLVTPEEGGELTRIEQRINLLLRRDEIRGLEAAPSLAPAPAAETPEGEEPGPPPPPPFGSRQRRHRRAL